MKNPKNLKEILEKALDKLENPKDLPAITKANNQISDVIKIYLRNLDNVLNGNELLSIGVVGQMKAGKSSFLNSLFFGGESILPIAATPMTAGLTTIEYTNKKNRLEICFYSKEDWDSIKEESKTYEKFRAELLKDKQNLIGKEKQIEKEMGRLATPSQISSYQLVTNLTPEAGEKIDSEPILIEFENVVDLKNRMQDFVGANGRYTSVVSILHIYINDERLKGVRIIDTPGVNDPVVSREVITHKFLHKCHGVFMLSRADHFMGEHDKKFMEKRLSSVGVNTILLIGSQFDLVLNNPQYSGLRLTQAFRYAINTLNKGFESRKTTFQQKTLNAICGEVYSAGMAQAILTKIEKNNFILDNVELDRYESHFLNTLKEIYPHDFIDSASIKCSLELLANFETIINIIRDKFIRRKAEIKKEKYKSYLEELINTLNAELDKASKDLQDELEYFKTNNLDDLKAQIEALRNADQALAQPIVNSIDAFASRFQNIWNQIVENIFSTQNISTETDKIPTVLSTIYYTRVSTSFLHRTRSGEVLVQIIDRESTKDHQKIAMQKYKKCIAEEWNRTFTEFNTQMLDEMVCQLQQLDPALARSSYVLSNIVKRTFDVQLADYKVLILSSILSDKISDMQDFVNDVKLTSFNKTLGEMSSEKAEENITKQATDNIKLAREGLRARDKDYMNSINEVAQKSLQGVVGTLLDFRESISKTLLDTANSILSEMEPQYENKRATIEELQRALTCLNNIKRQINEK